MIGPPQTQTGGATEVRREEKSQRKARSHCTEKELRSPMRGFSQDRDTQDTYARAVSYKSSPKLHSVYLVTIGRGLLFMLF